MQNNKVIFLQPPNTTKLFTRSASIYPPLGLLQLAAMDKNNIIEVIDAEGLNLSIEETENLLLTKKSKIIGLTLTSFTIDIVKQWSDFGKNIGAVIIVGGPHATLAPEDTFNKCKSVDYVVRGEAENIINELLQKILLKKEVNLQGVCVRNKNKTLISKKILRVQNFSNLPFPSFDNMPITNYWCPDAITKPMITLMTTRGCPFSCKFCSSSILMGKKIRGWTVDAVVKELKYLHFKRGINQISFVDDEFIINKKRTRELCKGIIDNNIAIKWFCNARADTIDIETASLMKQAGCHQIYLGFESGSQEILDKVGKKTTIDKMIKGANILSRIGIDRSVGFIIGLPGETDETVKQTIELAKKIKPERLQFTRFTPLIGTELYQELPVNGFHDRAEDKIGKWITKAYNEFNNLTWAKKSL